MRPRWNVTSSSVTGVLVSGVVSGLFCIPTSPRPTPGTLGWWETLNCSWHWLTWTGRESTNACNESDQRWEALNKSTHGWWVILLTKEENISGLGGIIWNISELLCGVGVDCVCLHSRHNHSQDVRLPNDTTEHWARNETPLLYVWEHMLQQAQMSDCCKLFPGIELWMLLLSMADMFNVIYGCMIEAAVH